MQNGIRNALLNGRGALRFGTNAPTIQYRDDQEKFYANETREFYLQHTKWSSDLVAAQVQGVNYDDFYAYTPLRIRVAQVIDPTTGNNLGDDWRRILIENTNIDFIPRGAKVVFNGNVWLTLNPDNITSITGTSIIKRCNATWCHLDWYGNILREPFCYGQGGNDLATANNVKINMILIDAYQHCVMQYNPETAELAHNRRILLGNQAYSVRGLQNFAQEFSEMVDGSTHIQFFDVTREEMLKSVDDLQNHVADGKGFTWGITLHGATEVGVGKTAQLSAVSMRNSKSVPNGTFYTDSVIGDNGTITQEVSDTGTERTVTYDWQSSDPTVATVSADGLVTAIAEGQATITCTLKENDSFNTSLQVSVTDGTGETHLEWICPPPETLAQFQTVTLQAALFADGEQTDDPIVYSFSGADADSYGLETEDGVVKVTAYSIPYQPLHVTATSGAYSLDADIRLTGW